MPAKFETNWMGGEDFTVGFAPRKSIRDESGGRTFESFRARHEIKYLAEIPDGTIRSG